MNYSCEYKPDPIPRLEHIYTYPDADKYIPKQYNKYSEIKFDSIAVNIEKLSAAIESTGDGETYKASEIKSK